LRLDRTEYRQDADWQWLVTGGRAERPFVYLAPNGWTESQAPCQNPLDMVGKACSPVARLRAGSLVVPGAEYPSVNHPVGGLSPEADGEFCDIRVKAWRF